MKHLPKEPNGNEAGLLVRGQAGVMLPGLTFHCTSDVQSSEVVESFLSLITLFSTIEKKVETVFKNITEGAYILSFWCKKTITGFTLTQIDSLF